MNAVEKYRSFGTHIIRKVDLLVRKSLADAAIGQLEDEFGSAAAEIGDLKRRITVLVDELEATQERDRVHAYRLDKALESEVKAWGERDHYLTKLQQRNTQIQKAEAELKAASYADDPGDRRYPTRCPFVQETF